MFVTHIQGGMTVAGQHGAFWDDLAGDLEDPQFAGQYAIESARVATIDAVVNSLDEARMAAGMSKAELARAIGSEPATIRRLFTAGQVNPTLGTVAEVAAALGFEIVVRPATTHGGRRVAARYEVDTAAAEVTQVESAVTHPPVSGAGVPVAAKAARVGPRPRRVRSSGRQAKAGSR